MQQDKKPTVSECELYIESLQIKLSYLRGRAKTKAGREQAAEIMKKIDRAYEILNTLKPCTKI